MYEHLSGVLHLFTIHLFACVG